LTFVAWTRQAAVANLHAGKFISPSVKLQWQIRRALPQLGVTSASAGTGTRSAPAA
jgi:hypothetical protein